MNNAFRRFLQGVTLFLAEFTLTLLLGAAGVVGFLAIGREVLDQHAARFDAQAFRGVRTLLGPDNGEWVQMLTFLASRDFIVVAALLLIGYFLLRRRHRWYTLLVPVVALGSISLNLLLKGMYQRPRPLLPLVSAAGLSFPSGHAMISASFYGLLVYLAQTHIRRPRLRWLKWALTLGLLALIIGIGLSRVYLRVHYASDVLAGFAAGGTWLLVAIPVLRQLEKTVRKRRQRKAQEAEKQS